MLARAIAQSVDLHTLTVRTDYAAFRDHLARRCHMRHLTAMRRGVGRLVAAGLLADLGDHSHRITYPRSHT